MYSYPVPNIILLPHDIEAQIQKRSSKNKSQPESQEKDSNGNGSAGDNA
jgi:hypothetical protein